ncbi:MAG: glutamate 5-kinase, partial [Kiritimatiellae bacterium]|nr:glutamate 5-kinase [Kiritimatiellia bacterium]
MSIDTLLRERAVLKDVRRVVVKVGTHAIAKKTGRPDYQALRRIVSGICALRAAGREVIFVSSGAVAAGVEALGLKSRPSDVNDIQMCAAVGQARYITEYERMFMEKGVQIGQVLLTHADFDERRRAANVRRVLDHLVKNGIVPVINENDVVADE